MKKIPFHPVANLWPLMTGTAFDDLCADVKKNGLLQPIWLWQGKIIDGRNRYLACLKVGVKPIFYEWVGNGSLVEFVVGLNENRRHETAGQRAILASKIRAELLREDRDRKLGKSTTESNNGSGAELHPVDSESKKKKNTRVNEKAAKLAKVSARTVASFERIKAQADPSLLAAVEAGTVAVSAAEGVVGLPREDQRKLMDRIAGGKAKNLKEAVEQLFPEDDGPRPIPCPHCREPINRAWLAKKLGVKE